MKHTLWKRYLILLAALFGVLLAGCLAVLLVLHPSRVTAAFQQLAGILMPFIYGAVIAYLLHSLCNFFEQSFVWIDHKLSKKKTHPGLTRMCSILLAFVFVFFILLLLIGIILPQLITSISGIISQLPDVVERFQDWISRWERGNASHELITYIDQIATTLSERLQNYLSTDVLPNMETILTEITSSFMNLITFLKNFGIGCIVSIYFLLSKEQFLAQGKLLLYSIFPEQWAVWISDEIRYADRMFRGFMTGKLLDSAIIGVICFLFCLVVKMPYALLVSIIVGVTNMIPFFGPYLGAVPSALLILTESPYQCIVFLLFLIILQQIDGNVIGPRILGNKLGLSGFWVLFAILFFGSLWGLAGMLIGVPLFAVIYDLMQRLVALCLRKRNQSKLLSDYQKQFAPKL